VAPSPNPPTAAEPLAPGSQLGGARIERLLTRGAMGALYLAFEESSGMPLAVKAVPLAELDEAGLAAAQGHFHHETISAARLHHPGIVTTYGGIVQDGVGQGQARYRLKSPYRDGTTHLVLEPLDFMARLAALVPPPRAHLTRYHGVFAPHAALRAAVTPAGRGPGAHSRAGTVENPTPRHVAMTWVRRLQRVFGIDIERCARCGGRLKVLASIEDPEVIARILAHRRERGQEQAPVASLGPRAPPPGLASGSLF
jgi:hypothetical protein